MMGIQWHYCKALLLYSGWLLRYKLFWHIDLEFIGVVRIALVSSAIPGIEVYAPSFIMVTGS